MNRRRLLALLSGGAPVVLTGCLGSSGDENGETPPERLPAGCPVSQDLGVEWPDSVDRDAAAAFAETYENEYLRTIEIGYEPVTRFDSYGVEAESGLVVERDGGFEVRVESGGAVMTPNLDLIATGADPSDAMELVANEDIEYDQVREVVTTAVETEEDAADKVHHGPVVEEVLDHLDELSADFDPPSSTGEEGIVHVDVDGSIVELTVRPDGFHGDWWLTAWYYVDENVLWRTATDEIDPRDGELLECRT